MNRAEAEMLEGYLDGRSDTRLEYPAQSNRSDAYQHGWLNGRDDRIHRPRLSAQTLRIIADRIIHDEDA